MIQESEEILYWIQTFIGVIDILHGEAVDKYLGSVGSMNQEIGFTEQLGMSYLFPASRLLLFPLRAFAFPIDPLEPRTPYPFSPGPFPPFSLSPYLLPSSLLISDLPRRTAAHNLQRVTDRVYRPLHGLT